MNNDRKRLEDLIMRLADDQQIMAEIYEMTNRAVYIFHPWDGRQFRMCEGCDTKCLSEHLSELPSI